MTIRLIFAEGGQFALQWSQPVGGRMTCQGSSGSPVISAPRWSRSTVDRMSILVARAGEVERLTSMERPMKAG
jgi:hypothetical protein